MGSGVREIFDIKYIPFFASERARARARARRSEIIVDRRSSIRCGPVNSLVAAHSSGVRPDDEILGQRSTCGSRAESQNKRPEVAQDRLQAAGLLVYRRATRRRKDVRITSKYLKIFTRNGGDPLLIKTAGSTCAFPRVGPRRVASASLFSPRQRRRDAALSL